MQFVRRVCFVMFLVMAVFVPDSRYAFAGGEKSFPNVVVLTEDEIKKYQNMGVFGALRLLTSQAGVTFLSSGDLGGEDWVTLRGFPAHESKNIQVLFDGVPMNKAQFEGMEWDDVPLSLVERIEIYKAPVPAEFGGYASGVVNIVSKKPDKNLTDLQFRTGSYKTSEFSMQYEKKSAPGLLFNIERISSDNLTNVQRTVPWDNIVYGDRSYEDIKPSLKAVFPLSGNEQVSVYTGYLKSDKLFSSLPEYKNRKYLSSILSYNKQFSSGDALRVNLFENKDEYAIYLLMHLDVFLADYYRQGGNLRYSKAIGANHFFAFGSAYEKKHLTLNDQKHRNERERTGRRCKSRRG